MSKKVKEKKHKKLLKEAEDFSSKLELDNIIVVKLSSKSIELLNRISKHGIYGTTPEIVAERFIDDVLQKFVEIEELNIKI